MPRPVGHRRVTGSGTFLGPNDASVDALVRHIDYAVSCEHVEVATTPRSTALRPGDDDQSGAAPRLHPVGPDQFMPNEPGSWRQRATRRTPSPAILGGKTPAASPRRSGIRRNGDGPRSTVRGTAFVGWHRVPHRRRPLHGRARLTTRLAPPCRTSHRSGTESRGRRGAPGQRSRASRAVIRGVADVGMVSAPAVAPYVVDESLVR